MKRMVIFFFLLILSSNASAVEYEPYTYKQDFETGEHAAWSSYPPIQDTAYEAPYIHPGKVLSTDEGTVLRKIIYPQREVF